MRATPMLTALLTLAIAATAVADSPVSPNPSLIRNPDYRGQFRGEPQGKVAIKVISGGTKVLFQAGGVSYFCEDGERGEFAFDKFRARLSGDGTFDIDRYEFSSGSFAPDHETYYRVHGQLVGSKRAYGFVSYSSNFFGSTPTVGGTDCSTVGPHRWTATPAN